MRPLLPAFLLLGLMTCAVAYQPPGPPDYAAITAAADVTFEGKVQSVQLAKKENQLTKVVLRITKVTKGDLKKGDLIAIYHKPGELASDFRKGIMRGYSCPSYVKLTGYFSYSIWAKWDAKKKHYFVPGAAWAEEKSSESEKP